MLSIVGTIADSKAAEFLNMLSSMDFIQHVNELTHNRGHTLDIVITHGLRIDVYCMYDVIDLAISDHYCIFFSALLPSSSLVTEQVVRKRYLTPEVAENVINHIHNIPPQIHPSSCEDLINNFNNKLKTTIDAIAPAKLKKIKPRQKPPWRTGDIINLKKNCRKAEHQWRKTKLHVHYDIFKEHLTIFNKEIRNTRQAHFSKLISKNHNNPRMLFSTIDSLINPVPKSHSFINSTSKCEEFAAFFRDKITKIRLDLNLVILNVHEPLPLDTFPPSLLPKTAMNVFAAVDKEMLRNEVMQLKPSTCSLDPIPTTFFKTVFNCLEQWFPTFFLQGPPNSLLMEFAPPPPPQKLLKENHTFLFFVPLFNKCNYLQCMALTYLHQCEPWACIPTARAGIITVQLVWWAARQLRFFCFCD